MERESPSIEDLVKVQGRNSLIFIPGTWGHGPWTAIFKSRMPGFPGMSTIPNTGQWFDLKGPVAAAIGIDDLNVHVLRWSERNSVRDRHDAAKRLVSHLIECLGAAPETKHFIIAHSHGGNIATMAFAEMDESISLKRLHFAALSTPFIWFHIRGVHDAAAQSLLALLLVALVIAVGVASLAWYLVMFLFSNDLPERFKLFSPHVWLLIVRAAQWTVAIAVFFFEIALLGQVVQRVENKLPSDAVKLAQVSLKNIMRSLGSVILFQPPSDEAWLGLAIPALGMWLNRAVGWVITKAWKPVAFGFVVGLVVFAMVVALDYALRYLGPRFEPPQAYMFFIGKCALASIYLIGTAPAQGVIYTILAVLGGLVLRFLGFDLAEGIALTLSTEVHVEHYPAGGPWKLYCPSERLEGLHHAIYESPEVQGWLADWVREVRHAHNYTEDSTR